MTIIEGYVYDTTSATILTGEIATARLEALRKGLVRVVGFDQDNIEASEAIKSELDKVGMQEGLSDGPGYPPRLRVTTMTEVLNYTGRGVLAALWSPWLDSGFMTRADYGMDEDDLPSDDERPPASPTSAAAAPAAAAAAEDQGAQPRQQEAPAPQLDAGQIARTPLPAVPRAPTPVDFTPENSTNHVLLGQRERSRPRPGHARHQSMAHTPLHHVGLLLILPLFSPRAPTPAWTPSAFYAGLAGLFSQFAGGGRVQAGPHVPKHI